MTLLKTLLFTLLEPVPVTVLVPWLLMSTGLRRFSADVGALRWVGLALGTLGVLIYAWTAGTFTFVGRGTPAPFDAPKELVATGLHRWVRNPMYMGVLAVVAGESLWFGSAALAVYAALLGVGFHLFVVLYEEPTLRRTFGASYELYCRSVPRWIPRVRVRHSR